MRTFLDIRQSILPAQLASASSGQGQGLLRPPPFTRNSRVGLMDNSDPRVNEGRPRRVTGPTS